MLYIITVYNYFPYIYGKAMEDSFISNRKEYLMYSTSFS